MSNWNKKPDEEKIYRWTEFFTSWTRRSAKCTRARVQENKVYIYLYISLYENLFGNGCIYIYIYKRGHHDDVTFMTPLTVLSVGAKTGLTLVFKLHLSLLIHSTKTLFFSSMKKCTYQLHTYSRRQIPFLRWNELQRNAACKKL